MTALSVLSPGLHTTVQDIGRFAAQHLGVPASGALDSVNLRLANLLVENDETGGALEMIAHGARFEVLGGSIRLALTGPQARMELIENQRRKSVEPYESVMLNAGDKFQIHLGKASSVCYLAAEGGFAIPEVMGSQSTFVRGGLGGFQGRTLREGDQILVNSPKPAARAERAIPGLTFARPEAFRIILGPQDDYFDADMIAAFLSAAFTVSHQSDRMGFRLSGFTLSHAKGFNIVSDGIAPGAIQVPGSGEPIILLADRQTTGGYPKIGVVISADLPALGRLRPGDPVAFRTVDLEEARAASLELRAWIEHARTNLRDVTAEPAIDVNALFEQNLIGGVVNAKTSPAD
jgi:allophanate hydrolase